MNLKDIAVKNLLRRKAKALFIMAGLAIGVTTVVTVMGLADSMTHDISHKLEKYGANILIVPRTDNLSLTYGGMALGGLSFDMEPIRQSQIDHIGTIKNAANVAAVGPIVLGTIKINHKPAMLAGIDFKNTPILKPWWKVNGAMPRNNEIMVGSDAAKILELTVGQSLTINGRKLRITGILRPTGSQDDKLIFTPLSTAQALLNKPGQLSMVEVAALCNACPIDEMVNQIAEKLPTAKVMAIQQVVKGRMKTIAQFRKLSYALSIVVVAIGALVVLVTLMGSVKERTEEIGIFRAIGFRQQHIMRIIFMETGMVSLLAGIIGYLLGIVAIWVGLRLFSDHAQAAITLNPWLASAAIAMAMLVGLTASAYPAVMAARMDPNQALRSM